MDKLLMMSILSSSPAEISGGSWTNLSFSVQASKNKVAAADDQPTSSSSTSSKITSSGGSDLQHQHHHHQLKQKQKRRFLRWPATARCAPELDGLNCFETLVLH